MRTGERQQILDRVKAIVLREMQAESVKIYLFGSWARGEERRSSDIDLAVKAHKGGAFEKAVRLREVLEESEIPYRVDVVDLAEAAPALEDNVMKEGVLWKD